MSEHDFVTQEDIKRARLYRKQREYRKKIVKGEKIDLEEVSSRDE